MSENKFLVQVFSSGCLNVTWTYFKFWHFFFRIIIDEQHSTKLTFNPDTTCSKRLCQCEYLTWCKLIQFMWNLSKKWIGTLIIYQIIEVKKRKRKQNFKESMEKNAHGLKVSQQIHKSNEYNSYSFMHNWSSYP